MKRSIRLHDEISSKVHFRDITIEARVILDYTFHHYGEYFIACLRVMGFHSLTGKFPGIVVLKFKLGKYFTSAREFHGSVVTSWWTSGNDRRKMSSAVAYIESAIRPRRGNLIHETRIHQDEHRLLIRAIYSWLEAPPWLSYNGLPRNIINLFNTCGSYATP